MKTPRHCNETNIILGQFHLHIRKTCSHYFQLVTIIQCGSNEQNVTSNRCTVCCPRAPFSLVCLSCRCRPWTWYMPGFCEDGKERSDSMKVGNLLCTRLATNLLRKVLYNGIPRNRGQELTCYDFEAGPEWLLLWLVAVRPQRLRRSTSITHPSVSPDCFKGIFKAIRTVNIQYTRQYQALEHLEQ
jgi:hypothetical protein